VNSLLGLQAGLAQQSSQLQFASAQVFSQAQLQVLSNRTALTQAELAANAQMFSATQSRKASEAASDAQLAMAEIASFTKIEVAELGAEAAQAEARQVQPAVDAFIAQFAA